MTEGQSNVGSWVKFESVPTADTQEHPLLVIKSHSPLQIDRPKLVVDSLGVRHCRPVHDAVRIEQLQIHQQGQCQDAQQGLLQWRSLQELHRQ